MTTDHDPATTAPTAKLTPTASAAEAPTATGHRAAPARAGKQAGGKGGTRAPRVRHGVALGRAWAAKIIMIAAVVAAFALGIGALLVGFGANQHNVLVSGLTGLAGWLCGPFTDLFTFPDHVKQLLVNWVIAAVAYLAAGAVLARIVRP